MPDPRAVGLMLWSAAEFPRRVAGGAAEAGRSEGVRCLLAGAGPRDLARLVERVDGIIAFTGDTELLAALAVCGKPAITVSARSLEDCPLPAVVADGVAAGRLAAEHLIARGLERLLFAGIGTMAYAQQRAAGFTAAAAAAGIDCQVVERGRAEFLLPVLRQSSKPLGVLAAHDGRARQVLDLCLGAGWAVPDEVAILGVDNTGLVCELAPVPLSSVDTAGEAVGRRAMELLLHWIQQGRRPPALITIPPAGVVERASTDCQHDRDPVVGAALAHIRRHALHGLDVASLALQIGVARRTLEQHLRRACGRSPYQLIQEERFAHAAAALRDSDEAIARIARRCGFTDRRQFTRAFGKRFGCTPRAWRTDDAG